MRNKKGQTKRVSTRIIQSTYTKYPYNDYSINIPHSITHNNIKSHEVNYPNSFGRIGNTSLLDYYLGKGAQMNSENISYAFTEAYRDVLFSGDIKFKQEIIPENIEIIASWNGYDSVVEPKFIVTYKYDYKYNNQEQRPEFLTEEESHYF